MSIEHLPSSGEGEVLRGNQPTFPPVVSVDLYERQYPLMHAERVYVLATPDHSGVTLALAHPEFAAGMFMGLSPDLARAVAAWLIGAANDIDGGRGAQ